MLGLGQYTQNLVRVRVEQQLRIRQYLDRVEPQWLEHLLDH